MRKVSTNPGTIAPLVLDRNWKIGCSIGQLDRRVDHEGRVCLTGIKGRVNSLVGRLEKIDPQLVGKKVGLWKVWYLFKRCFYGSEIRSAALELQKIDQELCFECPYLRAKSLVDKFSKADYPFAANEIVEVKEPFLGDQLKRDLHRACYSVDIESVNGEMISHKIYVDPNDPEDSFEEICTLLTDAGAKEEDVMRAVQLIDQRVFLYPMRVGAQLDDLGIYKKEVRGPYYCIQFGREKGVVVKNSQYESRYGILDESKREKLFIVLSVEIEVGSKQCSYDINALSQDEFNKQQSLSEWRKEREAEDEALFHDCDDRLVRSQEEPVYFEDEAYYDAPELKEGDDMLAASDASTSRTASPIPSEDEEFDMVDDVADIPPDTTSLQTRSFASLNEALEKADFTRDNLAVINKLFPPIKSVRQEEGIIIISLEGSGVHTAQLNAGVSSMFSLSLGMQLELQEEIRFVVDQNFIHIVPDLIHIDDDSGKHNVFQIEQLENGSVKITYLDSENEITGIEIDKLKGKALVVSWQ